MKKAFTLLFISILAVGCSIRLPNRDYGTTFFYPGLSKDTVMFESIVDSMNHDDSTDSHIYLDPYYASQIEYKIDLLDNLKRESNDYQIYTFYTDHHCFLANGSYDVDLMMLASHFDLIKKIQELSGSSFVMCGGDLLNNSDSKSQACYKLSLYIEMMNRFLRNSYILVGNHDTNCQGNTYIYYSDYMSCTLSQDTINDIFYNGEKSYYRFESQNTSFYCFDSGIDWFALSLDDYQKEQLNWFANSLLYDDNPHISIFTHIALVRYNSTRSITAMLVEIDKIVRAYNEKKTAIVCNQEYDYSSSTGHIDFIQSGHSHVDISTFCGDVPTVVTTSFASPEAVTRPTLDIAFVDYSNKKLHCLRIGDGEDRFFDI